MAERAKGDPDVWRGPPRGPRPPLAAAHPESQIELRPQPAEDPTNERFRRIYEEIRNRICTNHYPPGTILNETELGNEFQVSRTPIRRVLQKLNHDGLAETRNGIGTYVTDVDTQTFEDLYRLRMKLAEMIGEFSQSVDPEKHIANFERILTDAKKLDERPDYHSIGKINVAVVNALQELIGSEPLKELTALLYFRTARIWHKTIPSLDWTEESSLVVAEINEILRALRIGDIEGVGHVRRNFVAMAYHRLKRRMNLFAPESDRNGRHIRSGDEKALRS